MTVSPDVNPYLCMFTLACSYFKCFLDSSCTLIPLVILFCLSLTFLLSDKHSAIGEVRMYQKLLDNHLLESLSTQTCPHKWLGISNLVADVYSLCAHHRQLSKTTPDSSTEKSYTFIKAFRLLCITFSLHIYTRTFLLTFMKSYLVSTNFVDPNWFLCF